jgi:hypothetical protein
MLRAPYGLRNEPKKPAFIGLFDKRPEIVMQSVMQFQRALRL